MSLSCSGRLAWTWSHEIDRVASSFQAYDPSMILLHLPPPILLLQGTFTVDPRAAANHLLNLQEAHPFSL